jgi:hypothetical protein
VDQRCEHDAGDRAGREPLGADLIIPVLATGLTLYYVVTTAGLVWEARATGLFVGAVLLALCALQFLRIGQRVLARRGSLSLGELLSNDIHNRRRLGLLLLVALFIATVGWLGTTLGLFLLLLGAMLVTGVRNVRTLLAVALTTSSAVYVLLILLLNARLPRGLPEKLLAAAFGFGG